MATGKQIIFPDSRDYTKQISQPIPPFDAITRNLGALDLNANYFKALKVLDPNKLTAEAKQKIKSAFQPLKNREIRTIFSELESTDRQNFDKVVLKAFNIDDKIIPFLYQILSSSVKDRVTLKEK